MKARWWKKNNDGSISCGLCFRGCRIQKGMAGKCGVRFNENGILISPYLGRFCACAVDPVEKKTVISLELREIYLFFGKYRLYDGLSVLSKSSDSVSC